MPLAGRSRRRSNARWWLVAGVVATLVVLLVDASLKARPTGPSRTLAADAWVDRVLPVIGDSTSQGIQLDQLRANGTGMAASALTAQYDQVAKEAEGSLATVKALRPPAQLDVPSGFLIVCLQSRAQAATGIQQAVTQFLAAPLGTDPAPSVTSITSAVSQFGVANQAYQLFVNAMPNLYVSMPPSSWDPMPSAYSQPALTTFLTSVRRGGSLASTPDLAVLSMTTNPPAVGAAGSTQILAPSPTLTVQVTVGNIGNVEEKGVPVTAALSAAAAGPDNVSQPVTLQPGQNTTLTLGPLHPPTGPTVVLTVSIPVSPGETDTGNNVSSITFQMPAGAG